MKKIVCFLLVVSLMLSLSVFAFADTELQGYEVLYDGVVPYSLVPANTDVYFMTGQDSNMRYTASYALYEDGLWRGSGACLAKVSDYVGLNSLFIGRSTTGSSDGGPYYWWNLIGKFTDANGYVLQASDFSQLGIVSLYSGQGIFAVNYGFVAPATDNIYQFDDGYLQIALSKETNNYGFNGGYFVYMNVSNTSVVEPISFEVETMDFYMLEESLSVKPFTFGDGAHITTPPVPEVRDPNDASQYGSAQDQVQWYNDAFGGAVDPELDDKIVAGNDMLLQQEEIEQDVIADFQQYSSQVDPATLTFPTAVLNGMSFIGTTFMSSYNNLGDISFVISLSMMIGVVLVLIGRGEGALARGISIQRNEEYRAYKESTREAMRELNRRR